MFNQEIIVINLDLNHYDRVVLNLIFICSCYIVSNEGEAGCIPLRSVRSVLRVDGWMEGVRSAECLKVHFA